jgi:hypothetical protein
LHGSHIRKRVRREEEMRKDERGKKDTTIEEKRKSKKGDFSNL